MKRWTQYQIRNESNKLHTVWSGAYCDRKLNRADIAAESVDLADGCIAAYGLRNADKITLEIWRNYKHVLPRKGDIVTANIKNLINAVRRQIVRHKKTRKQVTLDEKAASKNSSKAWGTL